MCTRWKGFLHGSHEILLGEGLGGLIVSMILSTVLYCLNNICPSQGISFQSKAAHIASSIANLIDNMWF